MRVMASDKNYTILGFFTIYILPTHSVTFFTFNGGKCEQ